MLPKQSKENRWNAFEIDMLCLKGGEIRTLLRDRQTAERRPFCVPVLSTAAMDLRNASAGMY
jgi:hypothetical protein